MKRFPQGALVPALLLTGLLSLGCSDDLVGPEQDPQSARAAVPLQTRTYYVAADLVEWDYVPWGLNKITGEAFTAEESLFVAQDEDKTRIGGRYIKALYR